MSWEDFEGDKTARELCEKYYEARVNLINGGTGLMFLGGFGTGKTMTMNLLLKELLWDKYNVYATTFTSMIEMFTAGWKSMEEQALFQKKVKQSKVLLLDDIGKEMRTRNNLAESTFDDVLRSRVQDGRPTFITSNMTIEEMGQGYGSAVFSLLQEVSIVHEFSGDDYRQKSNQRLLDEALSGIVRPIQ
jgi:DNA replication protein DnaC